jgi:AraC-like DNA-binding protein/mannose-6-phosphate isomerase-like protein (cupin superfamily)
VPLQNKWTSRTSSPCREFISRPPISPSLKMDPLSDVLRAVRLTGAYFYFVEAAQPFSIETAPARMLAPRILPDAEHLIAYHVVCKGTCWARVSDGPDVLLQPGDVIMLPHGDRHSVSSHGRNDSTPLIVTTSPAPYPNTLMIGAGSPDVKLICGFLGCDATPFNPLIAALPSMLHMPMGAQGPLAAFAGQVLRESIAGRAGSSTMLTRMAELLFIEIVRQHLEGIDIEQTGWLAGLRDPIVGAALLRMHERPSHDWSLIELGREVSASRSVLAERFAKVVGIPPMQYLAQWRLQLAAEMLATGGDKVAAVGAKVGYDSEAAFSRAFKRATGASPAQWRKRRRPG